MTAPNTPVPTVAASTVPTATVPAITLPERYAAALMGNHTADPHQSLALDSLERLRCELAERRHSARRVNWLSTWLTRRQRHRHPPQGVYLWGGVGRGKTWLMDLFFDSLQDTPKIRAHFHRFMQSIHAELKTQQQQADPLAIVAESLARQADVICLDELYVSDIADAMLLGGLFEHLLARGTSLVFTSNLPPASLYRDGLQRQRFLPAIALLEQHCQVVCVDGPIDYRLRHLIRRPVYLLGANEDRDESLRAFFNDLSDGDGRYDVPVQVEGRSIPCRALADTVAWFDFSALCEGPRSQNDYVSLAKEFQTILLSDVPVMSIQDENAARRFIALVDEFYDRRVNLILTAAAGPTQLYRGERLKFEFERTVSRLIEMQSESYLASEHLA